MNPEVVSILITIDKTADKILKKYVSEGQFLSQVNELKPILSQSPRPLQCHSRVPSFVQQDRRDHRTLRAKVNCILKQPSNSLKDDESKRLEIACK
jgi:hypothetical protein